MKWNTDRHIHKEEMSMRKYRVYAIKTGRVYLDVEANSVEEAWDIAEDTDWGEYTEDLEDFANATWELERPVLIRED